jgi:hypothetical protein
LPREREVVASISVPDCTNAIEEAPEGYSEMLTFGYLTIMIFRPECSVSFIRIVDPRTRESIDQFEIDK